MEIVFRTPCTFHTNCDETAVALLHNRSAKDGPITDEEWKKVCWVCEGVVAGIKASLMKTGKWTCPVCGFVHTVDVANPERSQTGAGQAKRDQAGRGAGAPAEDVSFLNNILPRG